MYISKDLQTNTLFERIEFHIWHIWNEYKAETMREFDINSSLRPFETQGVENLGKGS